MEGIDPETLRQMGRQALRNLLDSQYAYIRELLDNDAAFSPGLLSKTRAQLRTSVQGLHDLGVEAMRE